MKSTFMYKENGKFQLQVSQFVKNLGDHKLVFFWIVVYPVFNERDLFRSRFSASCQL